MEQDLDDLSSWFIEASEKLEQWENWWKEGSTGSTDAQAAEPIDWQQEVLKPIIYRGATATAAYYSICDGSAYYSARVFAATSSAKVRSPKISRNRRVRATNPAIPVWIHKLYRLLLQLLRQARANIHHKLCQVHQRHLLKDHGQLHVKSCNPKIRLWTITLVPGVAGSAMHLLCR